MLGGRFGYFLFFSARGGGRGSPRRQEGGGRFFIENPTERGRGREGVCGELGNFGGEGGGALYFLLGPETSTKLWVRKNPAKFPPNFPQNFPAKKQEKFTDELLQARSENNVHFMVYASLTCHFKSLLRL